MNLEFTDLMYSCCRDERRKKMMHERFVLGYTYAEIAKLHGISRGRVYLIIRAIMVRLRHQYINPR